MKEVGGVSLAKRFDFGLAIHAMKSGERVRRAGWNGKGMWLAYVSADNWELRPSHLQFRRLGWIAMKTADDCVVPWLASQTDMLATDWEIVEES